MPSDFHRPDDVISELEKISIRTSQGSYVKMEDVRRLLQERVEAKVQELEDKPALPYRMTPERARRMAMRDEKLRERHSSGGPREPGKSIPSGPVANEGVKS